MEFDGPKKEHVARLRAISQLNFKGLLQRMDVWAFFFNFFEKML